MQTYVFAKNLYCPWILFIDTSSLDISSFIQHFHTTQKFELFFCKLWPLVKKKRRSYILAMKHPFQNIFLAISICYLCYKAPYLKGRYCVFSSLSSHVTSSFAIHYFPLLVFEVFMECCRNVGWPSHSLFYNERSCLWADLWTKVRIVQYFFKSFTIKVFSQRIICV